MKHALLGAALASLGLAAGHAAANPFGLIENQPRSELWVNPGFYSYHFDRNDGLDDTNPGIGAEYRFSTVAAATVGRFHNSDRAISNYAGIYYQPISLGPLRIGAVVGGFDGYPKMRNGGWFLAAIPVVSVEYERVGVNFAIVPSYKDRLHGALAIQLKFKLMD
ncbi:hypothetical protein IP92_02903 [Pseudoduganella flava]|uniref:Sn-glycerol-3-phosphate transporter n=1 Tax=Pseudoduganella flava TaxID=871742 RepID=A0A562PQ28_9BURK|nr:hypothetical protein [Pseudoduganella flava]QGZ37741.1 hypothetical protein GO485_00810 [Pseudoduganella flava]TWI46544.1 hypothetical protein IP92_02903 [Pseudoduganella flava]